MKLEIKRRNNFLILRVTTGVSIVYSLRKTIMTDLGVFRILAHNDCFKSHDYPPCLRVIYMSI